MTDQITELALVFLKLPDGRYVFQRRDAKAPAGPNELGLFGGHMEPGELPEVALRRELAEETSIQADMVRIEKLGYKFFEADDLPSRKVFYFRMNIESENFKVYEGKGAEVYSLDKLLERKDVNSRIKLMAKDLLTNG